MEAVEAAFPKGWLLSYSPNFPCCRMQQQVKLMKYRFFFDSTALVVPPLPPSHQTPTLLPSCENAREQYTTTLKVVKGIVGAPVKPGDCSSLSGPVVMEHPDKLINNFKGKLLLHGASAARANANEAALAAARASPPAPEHQPSEHRPPPAPGGGGGGGDGASSTGDIELTTLENARAGAHRGGGNASIGNVCDAVGSGGAGEGEGNEVAAAVPALASGTAGSTSEPISPDMLLLRGCVLRNTRWVLGLVLNTGPDTKIMMSMSKVRVKDVEFRRLGGWGGGVVRVFVCRVRSGVLGRENVPRVGRHDQTDHDPNFS